MMTDTPDAPRRRLDPAILPILVGAVVLVLALVFLFSRPPMPPPNDEPGFSARLSAVEDELRAMPPRLAAIEARPTGDPAAQARVTERLATLEGVASERQTAMDRRLAAVEAAAPRLDRLTDRIAALDAHAAEQDRRAQGADAEQQRRLAATEAQLAQRFSTAEAGVTQRVKTLEDSITARLAALEAREQRLNAAEGRITRLSVALSAETALAAGRPLGNVLAPLGTNAPVPLARFNTEAPPTEAALRLSFEDSARAARAAMEPGAGQGVLDAAASRLSGLITIRRGDTVVVGDAANAELERARRALEAGDLPGALARIDALPDPAKAAMADWSARARSLVEARAALRGLTVGG